MCALRLCEDGVIRGPALCGLLVVRTLMSAYSATQNRKGPLRERESVSRQAHVLRTHERVYARMLDRALSHRLAAFPTRVELVATWELTDNLGREKFTYM